MQCQYFEHQICRSCSWLDQPYSVTLEQKVARLRDLFPDVAVAEPVGDSAAGSRIRAKLAVFEQDGQTRFGFHGSDQKLIPVDDCPLHHTAITDTLPLLKPLITTARLQPYDMTNDRGEIKFVVVTVSPSHHQVMVQLVLRSQEAVDRIRRYWNTQSELRDRINVLSINIQPVRSSLIQGELEIPVSEQNQIPVRYGTTDVWYRPQSFIQTNYRVAEQLYATAARHLQDVSGSILDLYCGTGAFSLVSASPESVVRGFDSSLPSIESANAGAIRKELRDARYDLMDSPTWNGLHELPIEAVICNPPRRGLDHSVRELMKALPATRFVYSSCNPETLQRDLQELRPFWDLQSLQTFDMFPFTPHQEVLAILNRRI